MRGVKLALSLFLIIFLLNRFFSLEVALYGVVVMFTLFILLSKKIQALYDKLENRFIRNLNDRELQEEIRVLELAASKRNQALAPWDAHMTTFEVEPEITSVLGKTLKELQWRETIGVNVAMIRRGQVTIVLPQRDDRIYPGDKLFIICTDLQEKKMNAVLRPDKKVLATQVDADVELDKFTVEHDSPLVNKTIRESRLRSDKKVLVVGIERNGQRLLNPESTVSFEEGDVVWVVGEKKLIDAIA